MKNNKGFTLIELLVAATILGILAVFATVSYRNSVAESRWAYARAMTDHLAASMQRVKMDFPLVFFAEGGISTNSSICPINEIGSSSIGSITIGTGGLFACGYIENEAWNNDYFEYIMCSDGASHPCNDKQNGLPPLACVQIKDGAKLPADFKENYYCVYEDGLKRECRPSPIDCVNL